MHDLRIVPVQRAGFALVRDGKRRVLTDSDLGAVGDAQMNERLGAKGFGVSHGRLHLSRFGQPDMFGPDTDLMPARSVPRKVGCQEIGGRRADEARDEGGLRIGIDLERRTDLLAPSDSPARLLDLAVAAALAEDHARQARLPAAAGEAGSPSEWARQARREGLR